MRNILIITLTAVLLIAGCAVFQPNKPKTSAPAAIKNPKSAELIINPTVVAPVIEWGTPIEVPLDVAWKSGQKLAVQLIPGADTPKWLTVDVQPTIIDPPAKATVHLSVNPGEAIIGDYTLTLDASAFGFNEPVQVQISYSVRRQSGEFAPLLPGPVTIECRGICGKVSGGQLTFYDLMREKDQFCNDATKLPESQRIGPKSFMITDKGFGYGRTCKVAGVYETSGMLSFVNLGISPHLPRGAVLLSLRSVTDCWLSPDNTIAIISFGDLVAPYDVLTGASLARPCRASGKMAAATLDKTVLSSGACSWTIQ
jgi:hypothetical protein